MTTWADKHYFVITKIRLANGEEWKAGDKIGDYEIRYFHLSNRAPFIYAMADYDGIQIEVKAWGARFVEWFELNDLWREDA